MKKVILSFLAITLIFACKPQVKTPDLLPLPVEITMLYGSYTLSDEYAISAKGEQLAQLADYAAEFIAERTGLKAKTEDLKEGEGAIKLFIDPKLDIPQEGYELRIQSGGITIAAPDYCGIVHGLQTLRQMLPLEKGAKVELPCLKIVDYPRFAWRGLHLDVSRHFFTVDQVKTFLDRMAMYKFNRFHWHLTDDQGWRVEIKSHPELTEKGAWRKSVGFKKNQELGFNQDNGDVYGGFYTQDEIREVVAYAQRLGITVIPEIDLPGHSKAAIHAIPEIFCFPEKKLDVWTEGGVSEGVLCAGKERTFEVLEDVLAEICDLFPSEYIHIGGDEAPKAGWKVCPDCQARIKAEGLANENELQGYFMKRLEKYLNSKGRKMIGWDEITECGLSETATVMSWRGILPGFEAAEGGNDVVMTPGAYCYFDYPQSVNPVTKTVEGSALSLGKVYSFDPAPQTLSPEARAHIIGMQACQWTEHTPNETILYYKEYPRAIATAEVAWTPQEKRDWDNFYDRLQAHYADLDHYGIGYGDPCYDVKIGLSPNGAGEPVLTITSEVRDNIYYTLDGSEPTTESPVYAGPVRITESCVIKARMFRPDGSAGRLSEQPVHFHKALCKTVNYAIPYSTNHNGGGDFAMTNGMLEKWQGFEKDNADFTLDMGKVQSISKITTNWKYDMGDWIMRPLDVTYLISNDGVNFTELHRQEFQNTPDGEKIGKVQVIAEGEIQTRYIRVKATNEGVNPAWHPSAGASCWIFVDEVIVD